jgi:hypothetical protein
MLGEEVGRHPGSTCGACPGPPQDRVAGGSALGLDGLISATTSSQPGLSARRPVRPSPVTPRRRPCTRVANMSNLPYQVWAGHRGATYLPADDRPPVSSELAATYRTGG